MMVLCAAQPLHIQADSEVAIGIPAEEATFLKAMACRFGATTYGRTITQMAQRCQTGPLGDDQPAGPGQVRSARRPVAAGSFCPVDGGNVRLPGFLAGCIRLAGGGVIV
jgi:hypothetical protein